ncbi:phage tail assembly chaperone G [Bacillus sp. C1]
MKITLQTAEGTKDYYLPQFIPGSATFEASTLADEMQADLVPKETIEKAAHFITRVYGNQFTAQEFVDGTHVWFLSLTIYSVCLTIMGRLEEAIKMMDTVNDSKKKLMNQLEMKPKKRKISTAKS